MLICAWNASLSFQEYPYLLKNSHQADTVDTFSLALLSPARAPSKSVKYFTTMTCLACFLHAIALWTKSLKVWKRSKKPTVQGKSWIEAWNPNPTFSGGQRPFQSASVYNIFLAWYLSEGNFLPEWDKYKTQQSVCDSDNATDRGIRSNLAKDKNYFTAPHYTQKSW